MNQGDMENQDEENKNGENRREGFKTSMRRRFFQVYFELMKERNIDILFASIVMAINFIQFYGLLYNKKIAFPFKDDLYSIICGLCDIVRIYPLIEGSDGGGSLYYYIIAFGLILVILLYLLQLLYIDYSIRIGKFFFVFPIKLVRYCSSFFFWVLMMPIIEIFIGIFSCEDGHHIIDLKMECFSGLHIFYCALFSISLLVYFGIFLVISFFYNESRPYHTDAFARLDTNFETYMTLYKILITIIGHFVTQDKLHWLIIVIHILGSLNFCKMYLQYLPYYNSTTSILFGSGWFIYFWLSLNVLLLKALEGVEYTGQSIVILVGILLIFPATKQIRDQKIQNKIFKKKHDKIKSEYELDIYIHKLYRLIIDQHVNEVDEMILLGVVHNHQSECLSNECPLNNCEELYLPLTDTISDRKSQFSKDPILLNHLINSIYAEYAKSSNSTAVLHSTYAYFLFYQIGNIHTALLELNVAEKCDSNFQQGFTIYRAKRFIEDFLVNRFGKNKEQSGKQTFADLDVTIVITFESLFAKLNKEIEKSANDHIEFWSHLDSQMVDLNILHKLGLNIITNTKRINEIWHQLTKINSHYSKALQMYGSYLVQIKNDNVEGDEFLNQANQMARPKSLDEHVNDFELMFADDTAIVVISGNKESQAKIMKTNNGITKLFGYNTFEVHGHEVNILMPPIIGLKHNYFLEQFFKTGREKVINADLQTFAMLRAGHIFSVTLVVKPVPSLKNDIQYIGLIKPTLKDYDFILTDQYGRIDSISKGITSMLQLQPSFFKENEIFIQVICPQLCETERIKGTKDLSTKFEIWQGIKDLTFIIPRNFSNISQKSGGRGGGGTANLNHNQANNEADDEPPANVGRAGEPSFVGLKSPDHLKKVCNMFRNNDFKNNPARYLQTLKHNINYDSPEIYRGPVKTEIINKSHGSGYLQMKVYKILNPKKGGGSDGDSDSARGIAGVNINKNIKAMIDEVHRRSDEINSDELLKKLTQMKQALDQVKRGLRHPSVKQKQLNISTPNNYEAAEIIKYVKDIKLLEEKYRQIKQREEQKHAEEESDHESEGSTYQNGGKPEPMFFDKRWKVSSYGIDQVEDNDFMLVENDKLDYDKIKLLYPLKEAGFGNDGNGDSPDKRQKLDISVSSLRQNPQNINQNEISAFQDDSMMQQRNLLDKDDGTPSQTSAMGNRFNDDGVDNDEDGRDGPRAHFKDEDEHLDLLKDIKDLRKQQIDKSKAVKKPAQVATAEGGEQPKEGEEGAEAGVGETLEGTAAGGDDEKFLEEDTGSVASSTKSLMKHLRMLRNALYENYSPPSIRNLNLNGRLVYVVLLIITIVWYVYSKNIYQQLKDNIVNIHSSKYRMNSLTDIGSNVRILSFLQQKRVNKTRGNRDYEKFKRDSLEQNILLIQQAQNNLSDTYLRDVFTNENNIRINPEEIQLIYLTPAALPMFYYVDIWSAVMSVTVHALNIKELNLTKIVKGESSVFFILVNSLNNILYSIRDSTSAILDENKNISSHVDWTLQILLYVASGSLFVSICLIFPVATKVDKNKDELLRHFMLIDRDDVKQQLDKCRQFFNTMHDKEHVTQNNMEDIDDEELDKNEEEKDGAEGDEDHDKHKINKRQRRKNKMHKKFSTNFISLIIKFVVVLTVLEGYFLLCYFQSLQFLATANDVINESGTITQRQFSNNFLYQIMQEVLTTNGQAQVMNINSLSFIFNYLNETIKQQEEFLKEHSSNAGYHSDEFNNFFDLLIYQDVCNAIYQDTPDKFSSCQGFMGGILKKGLYSANVAYWDNMRSMATDFNNSARDIPTINSILNSDRLVDNENLKDLYFADSFQKLLQQLDSSILYNFDSKNKQDTILFACYIVILFLLYFILWSKFLEATRHSLWVTKSMLAIIPLEIIQKVPKIKDFLLASSKNSLSAFRD